jgi:ABC-type antimicrobial peptide transport system permease subunit
MLLIIYLVIAFGIFSTVLMMTAERKHEFGILLAIGMKRGRMQLMMFFETILLALLGIIAGLLAALPVMGYFGDNPIRLQGQMAEMYEEYGFEPVVAFSAQPEIFINQALIILAIVLVVYIYPWNKLRKIDAVEARE